MSKPHNSDEHPGLILFPYNKNQAYGLMESGVKTGI